jgi:TrmH family RNA methyltransferase
MRKPQEIVTSRQNALVKLTASLADRKFRDREGLFRFDGKKLLLEALDAALPLFAVLLRESDAEEIVALTNGREVPADCRAVILPDELFDRISEEKAPEGVICVARRLAEWHRTVTAASRTELEQALAGGRTLMLESVRDPGNLGTVIRSAAAFGVDLVVLSADCADLYHPRTVRAAMGTLFHTRVVVTRDVAEAVRVLAERGRVYAAALDEGAARLGEVCFGPCDTVIVGNEGHGLSAQVLEAATHKIYIPMAPGVESLNAGVAASVLLWELYRGR